MKTSERYEDIGDALLKTKRYNESLRAFRAAQNHSTKLDELKRLQEKIIKTLEKQGVQ